MLAAIVQPLYIKEGEHVVKIDDTGSELYFVYRGSIEVRFCNGVKSPQLVRAGRVLGEVAFFMNETSRISCQARENSDLYYATRKDFDRILEHYADVRENLMEEVQSSMDMDEEFKKNAKRRPRRRHHGTPPRVSRLVGGIKTNKNAHQTEDRLTDALYFPALR